MSRAVRFAPLKYAPLELVTGFADAAPFLASHVATIKLLQVAVSTQLLACVY